MSKTGNDVWDMGQTHLSIAHQCQVITSLLLYGGKGTETHLGSKMFHSTLDFKARGHTNINKYFNRTKWYK